MKDITVWILGIATGILVAPIAPQIYHMVDVFIKMI